MFTVAAQVPSGTVTFLFTDIEGSTRRWQVDPEAMRLLLTEHDDVLRRLIEKHRGRVFKHTGDGVAAAFGSASDAVAAAVEAQEQLRDVVPVRMGLHTGEADFRDGDYFGSTLNRCARLMGVAHGGQVVVSEAVESVVRGALPADVTLVSLGEHRLRDLARAVGVFQVTHPGLTREFPPLRSLNALPGNLPVQLTAFVGRDDDLTRVAAELRDARLVTLTGVGGVGKTRLALEVAAEVLPGYRDGAWLAELAGVRDPEAVPDALVAMFGLRPSTGLPATTTLVEFLRGKDLLLLLDNCEHLLRAVAELVAEVVRSCPGVRVLATSREGLNVAGERMLGVASLDVPPVAADLGTMERCDAVVLFVERARAVKATFTLDTTNADGVAQVCRRLDGIALAIELAAARVAMLTVPELARRLDSRFRLLAGGQRTAVERHQTLRAAIDWSYELLSETEQLLLARLSVFAGGFSLEAAEAVTVGDVVEPNDVFDLLAALVARSMVVADTEGIEARYRLLETIRQYAQECLDDSGDGDRLRTKHAAYYAGFAEVAIAGAVGSDGIAWERRLEREFDNFRAAITWATDTRDVDTALRLIGLWDAATQVLDAGLSATSRWACDTILAMPGASEHPKYPSVLATAAIHAWEQGDQERARRRSDEALAAEARLGTDPSIGLRLVRATIAQSQGRTDEAVEFAHHAVALARARGDSARLLQALAWSAFVYAIAGDAAAALPDADEAVALIHRLPNPHAVQVPLTLAAFALGDSAPERALALAREAIELAGAPDHNLAWSIAGDLAARHGDRRDALVYMGRAIETHHWLGQRLPLGTVIGRVGSLIADNDPEAAAVLQGAGDARASGFAHAPHTVEAEKRAIAIIDAALGEPRRHELYAQGAAMTDADAIAYAKSAITRSLARDTA